MDRPGKILVTGFAAFPGMPVNPTELLMRRLPLRLGARYRGVEICYHTLPATWSARQAVTQPLIREIAPDAVVHFGVAGSRRKISVETRAVNRALQVRCDAEGLYPGRATLGPADAPARFATLPARALQQAVETTGVPVALSRDAGRYLCNATLWDTLGTGLPAVFIHVPPLPRGRFEQKPALPDLERAGIAIIKEVIRRL